MARGVLYHNHPCAYCKRPMLHESYWLAPTRDHVIPKAIGGKTRRVWACRRCNQIKGHQPPARWAAFMLANPGWWLLTFREVRAAWVRLPHDAAAPLALPTVSPVPFRLRRPKPVVVPPELIYGANQGKAE